MVKKGNKLTICTIEESIKDFLEELKKKLSKTKVNELTFSRYSFVCERHIIPYFKGLNLNHLNDESINDFVQYKLTNGSLKGKPLSAKTVNDIVCLLLQVVKNYCKLNNDIDKPSYKQNEITIFTETEYNKLKTHLSIGMDSRKLGIVVAMLTGIRIGELCALKWENINLDNGIISIEKTMQRVKNTDKTKKGKTKIIIDTPKSSASIRTIPIPAILLNKLEPFKAYANTYLLTNDIGYIEPRSYQRYFKNYLETCNINNTNFHTLRHTFATMAVAREVDIKTLSVLLGHTDVSFTMKRYVHPNIEHKRQQIEKLAIGF